jgi:hypothetical protein
MSILTFFTTFDPWVWFGLAALLLIIEILLTNTGFLLWIAIAAAATGVAQWLIPGLNWYYQYLVFIAIVLLYSVAGKKYLRRASWQPPAGEALLNRRAEQYIGRVFSLEQAIVNGRGTVHVDDTFWVVEGPDLPAATKVRVVAAKGVILQVVGE